jgi:hypothetical protein
VEEMSIGEFARRSRLSPKALRLYDGLGLLSPALESWRDAQGIEDKQLSLTPDDLGVRITYLATPPITDTSVPDCDFAVPFA